MRINKEGFIRSLILLGFSALLFWLMRSNNIIFYINPRYERLTEIAAIIIFIMFLAQAGSSLRRSAFDHSRSNFIQDTIKLAYLPFMITLAMAFLLPDSALDANLAANKGMNLSTQPATTVQSGSANTTFNDSAAPLAPQAQNPAQEQIDEIRKAGLIKVTEENFTIVNKETYMFPEQYAGKEITMLGFVFKEPGMPSNQFVLGRYIITCCSADASLGGFLCEYGNTADFKEGSWLIIRGIIKTGKYNDSTVPIITINSFSPAQEPQNPYIYPVYY